MVATETVEHDIRELGRLLVPRFETANSVLELFQAMAASNCGFSVHFGPIASGDDHRVHRRPREA